MIKVSLQQKGRHRMPGEKQVKMKTSSTFLQKFEIYNMASERQEKPKFVIYLKQNFQVQTCIQRFR